MRSRSFRLLPLRPRFATSRSSPTSIVARQAGRRDAALARRGRRRPRDHAHRLPRQEGQPSHGFYAFMSLPGLHLEKLRAPVWDDGRVCRTSRALQPQHEGDDRLERSAGRPCTAIGASRGASSGRDSWARRACIKRSGKGELGLRDSVHLCQRSGSSLRHFLYRPCQLSENSCGARWLRSSETAAESHDAHVNTSRQTLLAIRRLAVDVLAPLRNVSVDPRPA